jgi:BRCA1 C Terminus (BRCT) domain
VSSAAQPSSFRLAVAEGLLSALHDSPLALDTARKLLEDPGLTLEAAERELRTIVESPRPCPTCGDVRQLQEGACANCGHVAEADTAADYPQRQAPRPRRKRKRRRTEAALDELTEATVINNALVAGSVTGTRTPWGGVNPAVVEQGVPLEALPGVTTPPNLRPRGGWEHCGNCVFYFKGCNLYGVGRPRADLVHALPYPVGRDDVCDSHASLTPQADRIEEARAELAEARRAGDTDRVVRLRARLGKLEEVSSRVYPSLERSPKENWVEKAGGLPSYIERIAKHLHYEKGMTISHAIATAVNTVKKWCAGTKGKTTAATKAKACAAVAQWEAKKARSKVSEAFAELETAARAGGSWRWPTLEEAGALLDEMEEWVDTYPALGSEPAVPLYVNRVAGHLRSKGKTTGQSIAIALTTARTVAAGDAGPEALREEARLAAAHWDALAVDGWWAAELVEAVDWETRDGLRLDGPAPPSEGFLRKLHSEIAKTDGPRWWEGMAEADAAELEESRVVRVLKRGAAGALDAGKWEPLKHPRVPKGRKGGGQFADVLGKLSTEAKPKAGREKPVALGYGELLMIRDFRPGEDHQVLPAPGPLGSAHRLKAKGLIEPVPGKIRTYRLTAKGEKAREPGGRRASKAAQKKYGLTDAPWGMKERVVASSAERAGRAKPPTGEGRLYPGGPTFRDRLISELTQMDERELKRTKGSRAKGYNPYALAIMFRSVQENFDPAIARGASPEEAFMEAFTPTRQTHGVAKKLGLGLDVDRGKWVKTGSFQGADLSSGDLPPVAQLKGLSDDQVMQLVDRIIPQRKPGQGEPWPESDPAFKDYPRRIAEEANKRATRRYQEGPSGRAKPPIPPRRELEKMSAPELADLHQQVVGGERPADKFIGRSGEKAMISAIERKRPFKSTHEYHPGLMDISSPNVIEGRPIEPGSPVRIYSQKGEVDPLGKLVWIEDEHGNRQSVWKAALVKPGAVGRQNPPVDDSFAGFVEQMDGKRGGRATPGTDSPGRGPSGKLRNFKAMSPAKLGGVIDDLAAYGGDPEAYDAAVAAAEAKGMHGVALMVPGSTGAEPVLPPSELSIDHAIGSVLKSHGDDLKDWHLSGPAPVGGQKRWTLDVELKDGAKHKILIGEDGQVELAGDAKPHAQHTAAAQAAPPQSAVGLQPTGETEKPYHMADGTYFLGADDHTYQKLESGPKLMQGKNGPLAAVRIRNVDLGTEKVAPAFALQTYYEILEPGGGGGAPAAPEPGGEDVYELLKKSVGGAQAGGGESIQTLAGKVPAGGYMAVEKAPDAYDVLQKMEQMPSSEYQKLNDADLQRVYETAEDVNYHTVAGMAWQVLQERQAAGKGKVGGGTSAHLGAQDLAGKNVVITGAIEGMTRKEAAERLAAVGATLQSSVTKATDYLITGKNVGKTKTDAAVKKGVTVVSVSAVMHLLEAAVIDDAARLAWAELELAEADSPAATVRLRARRDVLEARVLRAIGRAGSSLDFDPSEHPREPKGRKTGGKFARKPGGKAAGKPRTRKGIHYWPTFEGARAERDRQRAAGHPNARVVRYEVGHAVQLEKSGDYVGPSAGTVSARATRAGRSKPPTPRKRTEHDTGVPGEQKKPITDAEFEELRAKRAREARLKGWGMEEKLAEDHVSALNAAIGYALDEDHASAEPGWLEDRAQVKSGELDGVGKKLSSGEKLTAGEHAAVQAVVGWLLDEDHESEYDDWLYEKTRVTVAELDDAATALRNSR